MFPVDKVECTLCTSSSPSAEDFSLAFAVKLAICTLPLAWAALSRPMSGPQSLAARLLEFQCPELKKCVSARIPLPSKHSAQHKYSKGKFTFLRTCSSQLEYLGLGALEDH